MLSRIYIDNFRCFVNFEYITQGKQLLLGANGSGKSTLLTAVRYLKEFVKGKENPFTQSARTRWQQRPLMVLEIEAVLEDRKYEYRVEIRLDPETTVHLERLKVDGTVAFELANGEIRFFTTGSNQSTGLPFKTAESALHLAQLSSSHVRRFVEWMGSVHCFKIDEYPLAMDESADREDREPDSEFQNLAGWYRHLVAQYPEETFAFLSSLRKTLLGFQALRFSPDEDGTQRLRVDFAGPGRGKVTYAISELSDGQRCLIVLHMILNFLIVRGHTVFIDEPDNFVALHEIQPWLLAAEEAVEDHGGQLILISHHPELLDLWAATYGLRFFREENGHVRTEAFRTDSEGMLAPSELVARGWESE